MGRYVVAINISYGSIKPVVVEADNYADAEDQAMYKFENTKVKDLQGLETHVEIIPLDDLASE